MDFKPFPVIRLTIERMQESIVHALHERHLQLDQHVNNALEKFCSEGYIADLVETAARNAIAEAVKQETERYYLYGDGRHAIHAAVARRLEEQAETARMFDKG